MCLSISYVIFVCGKKVGDLLDALENNVMYIIQPTKKYRKFKAYNAKSIPLTHKYMMT
jgi:hypothetical protein